MKNVSIAVALLALAGCTGVDGETYLGRPGSPAWFSTASPATIATHYRQQCVAYGFAPGTPAMSQCIQREVASGRQAAAARSASANAGMMQASAIMAQQNQYRRPVHCTSMRTGSLVSTNCY